MERYQVGRHDRPSTYLLCASCNLAAEDQPADLNAGYEPATRKDLDG